MRDRAWQRRSRRKTLTSHHAARILGVGVEDLHSWSEAGILLYRKSQGGMLYDRNYIHGLKRHVAGESPTTAEVTLYYLEYKKKVAAERKKVFSYHEAADDLGVDLATLNDLTRSGFLPFTIRPDGYVIYPRSYIFGLRSNLPVGLKLNIQWAEVHYLDHQAQDEKTSDEERQRASQRCRQLVDKGILLSHATACTLLEISKPTLRCWADRGMLWCTQQGAGKARFYLAKEVELLRANLLKKQLTRQQRHKRS